MRLDRLKTATLKTAVAGVTVACLGSSAPCQEVLHCWTGDQQSFFGDMVENAFELLFNVDDELVDHSFRVFNPLSNRRQTRSDDQFEIA